MIFRIFTYICVCEIIILISNQFSHKGGFKPLMKRLFQVLLAVGFAYGTLWAQQDPQFSMYMFNRQYLNPAHSGSLRATNFTLGGRMQWVGIEGAPNTATFSINGRADRLGGGVGAYAMSDRIGPIGTLGAGGQYAYRLVTSRKNNVPTSILQLGLNLGFWQKSLNPDWRYNQNLGFDPLLFTGAVTSIVPDVGSGAYFYMPMAKDPGRHTFYAGTAVTHITEPRLKSFTASGEFTLRRQFTFTSGYNFKISQNAPVFLEPSVMVKTDFASWQYDFNTNVHISPLVLGVSFRGRVLPSNSESASTNKTGIRNVDALAGIVGFQTNNRLFIAYSYDYSISRLSPFTSGTHEIIVSYTLPKPNKLPKLDMDTIDKKFK